MLEVELDAITIFGAIVVSFMLLFYILEARAAVFVLAFAAACLASSIYGFLQGAWPFGVIEGIWTLVAINRWRQRTKSS